MYVTIEVTDLKEHNIDLKPDGQLIFKAKTAEANYAFDFALFGEVNVEGSKWNTKGRYIILNIEKKEEESWPRITKEKVKNNHIQVDWNRWVDSDEEDEKEDDQDFDPSNMQDFGGMGGMPGMGGMGGRGGMEGLQ